MSPTRFHHVPISDFLFSVSNITSDDAGTKQAGSKQAAASAKASHQNGQNEEKPVCGQGAWVN